MTDSVEESRAEESRAEESRVEEFRLPDLGEGLTDAEMLSWSVAVGDQVELNQVIGEVETAKAAVELPSPFAGTVVELLASPGDTVPVGSVLLRVRVDGTSGGSRDPHTTADTADTAGTVAERPPQVLVGYGPGAAPVSRRGARRAVARHDEPASPPARKDAKPAARREAAERGIDLAEITGTGPGGVVTRDDVLKFAGAGPVSDAEEIRTPIRGVRKRSADAVARSAFTAPHATVFLTCDATATVELVARLRASTAFAERHLTALTIVASALLRAVDEQPALNSSWDGDTQEIVTHTAVHLGIATATDEGLKVPVVRSAQALSLPGLAGAIATSTERARSGAATPSELVGSTISITNVGVFGVDAGTPILNPGEAAILAVGAIADRPWVVDGTLTVRKVVTLSLSFDHRLVDGEQAGRALAAIGATLTDPVPVLLSGS